MGFWDKLIGTKARTVYAFFFTAFAMGFVIFSVPEAIITISIQGIIALCLIQVVAVVAGFWIAASSVSEEVLLDLVQKVLDKRGE